MFLKLSHRSWGNLLNYDQELFRFHLEERYCESTDLDLLSDSRFAYGCTSLEQLWFVH